MNKTQHMSAAAYRALIDGGADFNKSASAAEELLNERYRNRCSSDRGRAFENLLMKGCRAYADEGRAIINKVYEPYIVTKLLPRGKFEGRFIGRAEPDFKGVLIGGRAIAFEAKSTQKTRIQKNALTEDQDKWLEAKHNTGALALVCVEIKDRFFTIPWTVWNNMKAIYGKKFLMTGDIPEYEVEYDGAVRFLDYVNGKRVEELVV